MTVNPIRRRRTLARLIELDQQVTQRLHWYWVLLVLSLPSVGTIFIAVALLDVWAIVASIGWLLLLIFVCVGLKQLYRCRRGLRDSPERFCNAALPPTIRLGGVWENWL